MPDSPTESYGPDREYHVFISLFLCRNTSGKFLSVGPATPGWSINNTVVKENYYTEKLSCIITFNTLNFLTATISVVGTAGNATVLRLLGFHMHRYAFSVYVFNLAGADFLYLCTQTVYSLECVLQFDNSYFYFLLTILMFAYLAALCMIPAISTERCLSVTWPIWYHCQRPRHTSATVCALFWAFSLLLRLLLGQGCGFLFGKYDYYFCRYCSFITTAFLIVLFVVPFVSSLAMLTKIICGSHRIPVTRFYVTIAVTVLVFTFFGLPVGIISLLLPRIVVFRGVFYIYKIVTFLYSVNCCANPIIYFLIGSIRHHRLQRQSLKLLLQRAMQDTPEEEGGVKGPSQKSNELEIV
ncbi:mas-related G-protein coupled receptor member B5 [Rattus norvegicus]|uniref:Mas-related G-protein coupled receptor member B5 n=1 Tax=Rattus norvegicus TaxID=10116 RepID=MRGB5_RAT|nr:mas-related G-protein coupled receptor member B5 [Rattus norvegicus]Q7TN44.1 RecName: Full=Mas-related G-protein coupled receptor member B5 [Rattus norvegicus]AAQ08315.1 MRGB5 G protein-coupled receptor [Rattus norvegicus]|eukprot:NP_001002284.1 mas-related G-protein coupled receptor member B5 [Rattus norvegicus]